MWIRLLVLHRQSTCSLKPASSFLVTRFRPISPIPSTVGFSREPGYQLEHLARQLSSSASFGFSDIQV